MAGEFFCSLFRLRIEICGSASCSIISINSFVWVRRCCAMSVASFWVCFGCVLCVFGGGAWVWPGTVRSTAMSLDFVLSTCDGGLGCVPGRGRAVGWCVVFLWCVLGFCVGGWVLVGIGFLVAVIGFLAPVPGLWPGTVRSAGARVWVDCVGCLAPV